MFRSATFKLTLWYLALVMGISLIFSFVLYQVTSREIASGLQGQSARIYTQFPVFEHDPILRPNTDIERADHRILLRIVLFNGIVLITAGFASYALARRTLAPIEEAHEQQTRFTSDVSHELRTPLTALRMESEVALMNPASTKASLVTTLESNLEEVGKLELLVNTLLRLTQLEAIDLQDEFKVITADELIDGAISVVSKIAASRHITLERTIETAVIEGELPSLTQLIVIVLDNAVKYSPDDSTVRIRAQKTDHELVIQIEDTGSGIPNDALEHVFDRFYRAETSRNKLKRDGFGLGLSIAKLIADVHGGVISLSSQVDHGTTVTIRLPLAGQLELRQ